MPGKTRAIPVRLAPLIQAMRTRRPSSPCNLKWILCAKRPPGLGEDSPKIRVVDLFCGCGGLSLGVAEACRLRGVRTDIALALDADEDALQVYRQNFGVACQRADCVHIERLFKGRLGTPIADSERRLSKELGRIDLLVAGPPCQGHSDLNNHSRRLDRRNALYARVARAAEVLDPSVIIIENVIGIANDRGRVLSRVRRFLAGSGYAVESLRIDARDLGVAQRRRRHFLVAFKDATAAKWQPLPRFEGPAMSVGAVLAGIEDEPMTAASTFRTASKCMGRNQRRIDFLFSTRKYDLPDSRRPPCHKHGDHSYQGVYGRLRNTGAAHTITSGFGSMGQGRYVHPTRRRMITPHEAARLQGFPDWYRFDDVVSRGSLQSMIGNAVIPRVAAWITGHLLDIELLKPKSGRRIGLVTVAGRALRLARTQIS